MLFPGFFDMSLKSFTTTLYIYYNIIITVNSDCLSRKIAVAIFGSCDILSEFELLLMSFVSVTNQKKSD
jgi:hypothetical protein